MKKKVIIIGGGISGLCAGNYLQMNGYDTEIYELHSLPGGLCTSWSKEGYTFDGCIHWLVGSNPESNYYKHWNELIDMSKLKFFESEQYFRIIDTTGKEIILYRDIDRFEQSLLSIATDENDKYLIKDFCNAGRKFTKLELPIDKARELMNLWDGLKFSFNILPYFKDFNKWMKISASEYSKKFKNPLLTKVFELLFVPEMSMLFLVFTLAWMSGKNAGYPVGGSLNFARLFEERYNKLGGKIYYRSKVKKIITENNSATGIILENGETKNADIIISAADGHYTFFEMLDIKYIDDYRRKIYDEYKTFSSFIQVSLGIAKSFDDKPDMIAYLLDKPIIVDDQTSTTEVAFRIFNFDRSMSPEGKTSVISAIGTKNYQYWIDLKKNNLQKYKAEKERIANEIIAVLDSKIGNIKEFVEVVDVSTPSTVVRYTNNWKGSFEGWMLTPEIGLKTIKKEVKGLKNFYHIGQWVEPGGGIPSCLISGRSVAQIICHRDKIKFKTS